MIHIREAVFEMTQAEMAEVAGTTQSTVSKWERGVLVPSVTELGRIRDAALKEGLPWDDAWFFEAPATVPAVDPNAAPVGRDEKEAERP